ncbi:MAG: DEAD/DEAH box helicase [Spirochaetaceae bacterium]|nr:DEAD/DEAH box helicase [Spirochaetaceae bacterium]
MNDAFHRLIKKWFKESLGEPTPIQKMAWDTISKGENVLLSAPTGSGKTLASFLWSINQLICHPQERQGISILYISPLKALNNDIQRNLKNPLKDLEAIFHSEKEEFPSMNISVRSGDTAQSERQRVFRNPPNIFITTPESLHILLTSPRGRQLLKGIKTVIVDEIHNILESRRGILLTVAMERLVVLNSEFQRIGLSATVEPMDRAAGFLGGYKRQGESGYIPRKVKLLRDPSQKNYTIQVISPPEGVNEEERWSRIARLSLDIIQQNESVLFFTDSRRVTEKAARLINDLAGETLVWAHHGSLSKELRHQVEQRMKQGELRAIVATSSLELGIDIGNLDRVVFLQCPGNLSSALQRMGRAGHSVGQQSKSTLIPLFRAELLQSAAMIKALNLEKREEIFPLKNPLDVLAQLILSMCHQTMWDELELFALLRSTWTYHDLPKTHYDLTVNMVCGRYIQSNIRELEPRLIRNSLEGTIKAREKGSWLIYTSGGVIPDRGYFDLRLSESKVKIGELDEEFVWERNLGESFSLGNQIWRITAIKDSHVEVIPAKGMVNIVPFWKAEDMSRSPIISESMLEIMDQVESSQCSQNLIDLWQREYFFDKASAQELLEYLKSQRKWTGASLPGTKHLLLEHCRDNAGGEITEQLIIHSPRGGAINQPYAIALVQAWQDKTSVELPYFVNNEGITLLTAGPLDPQELLSVVKADNLMDLLKKKLGSTAFFGTRYRECAGRAMLLPKKNPKGRVPLWLNRLRSKKILSALQDYQDFPITLETWRTCLEDHFDIPGLQDFLRDLNTGEIFWTQCHTDKPSPMASSLVWRQVNLHMYEDDSPSAGPNTFSDGLLKELLQSSQLKPQIQIETVEQLEERLQRLRTGYGAESAEELKIWLEKRGIIPLEEWQAFLKRSVTDSSLKIEELLEGWEKEIVQTSHWVYLKHNHHLFEGLITQQDECIFLDILQYYGPRTLDFWQELLGPGVSLSAMVENLVEQGQVLYGPMLKDNGQQHICTMENLEYLLRMSKKSRIPVITPRPLEELPLFVALQQGLLQRGQANEDIQNILDKFIGLPLAIANWEKSIFPCRMEWYNPHSLDEILMDSSLQWRGESEKQICFLFPEETNLWMSPEIETLEKSPTGLMDFFQMKEFFNLNSRECSQRIWELVWQGACCNTGFKVLRKALQNNFKLPDDNNSMKSSRRGHYNRWLSQRPMEGYWYFPDTPEEAADELEDLEQKKERVRQLLNRYPIIARPLLQKEKSLLGWRQLFPALRLMELSGELISGVFFKDLQSLQFTTTSLLQSWKDLDSWKENIWYINAQDPASFSGLGVLGISETLPRRVPGNYMVYQGSKLMMSLENKGKRLRLFYSPGESFYAPTFLEMLLSREVEPYPKIEVEEINEEPAAESPRKFELLDQGFKLMGEKLVLRRIY